ncbi:MAG TPA: MFS transporter [Bradyrhizobium sp.]|nr:MFS transporter [Bradyrhizobium sp.]
MSFAPAFIFVLTMGAVNFFGDVTYEGGGSINGQFLGALGASAAIISIVAGAGEFLGYSLRSVSGYVADRTGRYWLVTLVGYAINALAVPAMVLATSWQVAAVFLLLERIGRAIRKPTVEAMLSYSTGTLGKGWVYGLNTALDEAGATLGPLLVALVLYLGGNYRAAYGVLLISALLTLGALAVARINFPLPSRLEEGKTAPMRGFTSAYWTYMAAASCFAAGLMSFELIAYHLAQTKLVAGPWIPVMLAFSTFCAVIASLVLGKLYDRVGMPVVFVAVCLSALFAPLVFQDNLTAALLAMPLWGIGYATQDTLFKVLIARVLPEEKRNTAFGVFYIGYGAGWLIGSIATGLLYDHSRIALVMFVVAAQLVSLPVFFLGLRQERYPAS